MREIETLRQDTVRFGGVEIGERTVLPGVRGRMLDMELTFRPESGESRFTLLLARDADHEVCVRYDPGIGELLLDRSRDGSGLDIAHMRRVKADLADGRLTLRALLDKESLEIFVNGGEKVLSVRLFAPPEADGIVFSAAAPCALDVAAHHLGNIAAGM